MILVNHSALSTLQLAVDVDLLQLVNQHDGRVD